MLSVAASCHQGHPKFFGNGRQCVANSYAAMIHHSTVKKASKWSQEDLDQILMEGDNIYYNVQMGGQKEDYLFITDLPNQWNNCDLKISKPDSGLVSTCCQLKPYVTLNEAIRKIESFLFLTIKCYTKAIIKENDIYHVFDPHSRNRNGMVQADGKAMVTSHGNFENLILFLEKFALSLGEAESESIPFETTPVSIVENTGTSDSEDFEGFSEISDGEYSCLLQINKENKDEKIKMCEEELESVSLTSSDDLSYISESVVSESSVLNDCESSSLRKSTSELSEDDIPLSKLSELLKFDTLNSDSEQISSGSEYQFSKFEKKMLTENYTETDSSDFDSVKQKKRRKRKNRKRKSKTDKVDKSIGTSGIEHSYCSKGEQVMSCKVTVEESFMADLEETAPYVVEKEQKDIYFEYEDQETTADVSMEEVFEEVDQNLEIAREITTNGVVVEEIAAETQSKLRCNEFESGYVIEVGQDLDIAGEITIEQVSEEEIVSESELQYINDNIEMSQDLGKAREVTVEELYEGETVHQGDLELQECQSGFDIRADIGADQDFDIAGDTATTESTESIADNSMEEPIGDVSFDGCVSGSLSMTELARGRKRTRNPDNWRRNKDKQSCNTGERYINSNGKIQHAKKMGKGCGMSCRYKCHSMFTEEDREDIFHHYWKLGDVTRQRQFLLKYSAPQKKKSKKQSSSRKREISLMWSLPLNGMTVRVCKTFFLHTLNISPQRIHTAMKKSQNTIGSLELDKRGSHDNRPNRTPQDKIDCVLSHIKSFPAVESHYCRKDSKKMYLSADLTVTEMYHLYLQECAKSEDVSPVSFNVYSEIFNTRFNIAFQKPMKDQCDLCNQFRNASTDDRMKMEDKYDNHIENKTLARENKEQDKTKAQENKDETFLAACFDLEQVLMTPKAFESSLYYKRRLNTFNFSIYDLGSSEGYCYVWNESISGRGACEISSGVYDFLIQMSKQGKKNFVFYSDNCGAQNKNKYYVSMLWYTIQKYNLESVEQKYLEKGHTQNENDSVHACIERASRQVCVYTTGQWAAIMRTARRKNPYHVKEMDLPDFFDFKSVSKMLRNFDLDSERNKVRWTDVRSFKIESSNPNVVAIKYDYNGPVHYLDLVQRLRRSLTAVDFEDITLNKLHKEYPKISFEKYRDLISLCKSGVIPYSHHMYYAVLSHEIPNSY